MNANYHRRVEHTSPALPPPPPPRPWSSVPSPRSTAPSPRIANSASPSHHQPYDPSSPLTLPSPHTYYGHPRPYAAYSPLSPTAASSPATATNSPMALRTPQVAEYNPATWSRSGPVGGAYLPHSSLAGRPLRPTDDSGGAPAPPNSPSYQLAD
ncbi:hypothetical protein EJ06DRAFT_411963 [Trichodelitschia bisporula]|uniref:Uncharacterized protein n=1 Tax=Trichodelitschia bisporula TaxID=703511 RepID=A0A6G1HY95_9PEZI|nr:hypothetical protein EJ06DRAFT_411963 [Trichodelitschia bisporula]